MKKFFLLALILLALIVSACGGQKTVEQSAPAEPKIEQPALEPEKIDAIAVKGTLWAIDEENMKYLTDAVNRKDSEYLKQLVLEKKIFHVDRDTKVTRIGTTSDEGNVMISFKEGRYTNKTGYTFAYNVFTEEDYPAYLETMKAKEQAERQKIIDVIHSYLVNIDDYFELILAGNTEGVKEIEKWIKTKEYEIIALKDDNGIPADIRECAEKAQKVVIYRYVVIHTYLEYGGVNEKDYQKAEKLRQEFKAKYGF